LPVAVSRQLAHDDVAAIAADLVRRGGTRPERIAAEGGSNGGTLIANMLTLYPERLRALFCTIPVIDLRRLKPLKTAWIDELGDPDKPEDWVYLSTISAYHAAVPGKRYPPILLATNRRDDRVLPGHARKMAAKLQAMGYEAWYCEPGAGGHGYGKDHKETAAFMAIGVAFMKEKIGWTDLVGSNLAIMIRVALASVTAPLISSSQRVETLDRREPIWRSHFGIGPINASCRRRAGLICD
jgi:prolyl oligopeptidase